MFAYLGWPELLLLVVVLLVVVGVPLFVAYRIGLSHGRRDQSPLHRAAEGLRQKAAAEQRR
jgi:hypothetical protein